MPTKQPGFLERIGMGILSPFARANRQLGELGSYLTREPTEEPYAPQYMAPQELEAWKERPFLETAKPIAGMAAWAVPGGGTFGQSVGRGALAAGMGGFGASERGKELQATVGGAATGGVLGGVLQQVGVGLGKLKGKGALPNIIDDVSLLSGRQRRGLINQAKGVGIWDDALAASANVERFTKVRNSLAQKGLKVGNTSSEFLENLYQGIEPLVKTKETGLASIGRLSPTDIDSLIFQLDDTVRTSGITKSMEASNALKDVRDALTKVRGNPSAEALDDLAIAWRNQVNYDATGKFPVKSTIYDQSADNIVDFLKGQSDDYRVAKESLHNLLGAQGEKVLQKTARGVTKQGIKSALVTGLKIPTGGVKQQFLSRLGRFQEQGLGQLPLLQKAMPAIQRMAPPIGGAAVGGLGAAPTGVTPTEGAVPGGMGTLPAGAETAVAPTGQPALGGLEKQLMLGVLSGQIDPGQAEFVLGMLGMGEEDAKKTTEKDKLFALAGEQAQSALSLLEGGQAKTGKLEAVGGGIGRFFGQQSEAQGAYRSQIALARSTLMNALLGARMSPQEMERLEAFIPEFTDEPQIAENKLRNFVVAMEQYGQLGLEGEPTQVLGY